MLAPVFGEMLLHGRSSWDIMGGDDASALFKSLTVYRKLQWKHIREQEGVSQVVVEGIAESEDQILGG